MTKVKPEWYQAAYNKLYGFIRRKHPEVLEEYKAFLKEIQRRLNEGLAVLEASK